MKLRLSIKIYWLSAKVCQWPSALAQRHNKGRSLKLLKKDSDWWGLTTACVCLNCQLTEVGNDFSRRQTLLLILINSFCIVVYRNMSAFSINLPASLFSNIFQLATWPFTVDRCCHSWYTAHMTSGNSAISFCWCWLSFLQQKWSKTGTSKKNAILE